MKIKEFAAAAAAAAMLFAATGCHKINQTSPWLDKNSIAYGTTVSTTGPTASVVMTTVHTEPPELPVFSQVPVETAPAVLYEEFETAYQAEDMPLPASFVFQNEKTDYTGSGYVSGLTGELQNTFMFSIEVPASGHYDISVVACAEEGAEFTVTVNDEHSEEIAIESSMNFICAKMPAVYLQEGENRIAIKQNEGEMFLDCAEVKSSSTVTADSYVSAELSNENASEEAQKLMEFICEKSGNGIITGQHVSGSMDSEILKIAETTGKYPAIRFGDMYPYSTNGGDITEDETVSSAISWSRGGGITGLIWHWFAPAGAEGTLEQSDAFSLEKAVTFEDVAGLDMKALEKMQSDGTISEECVKLIADIDSVSEGLKKLRDAKIPVLWHPLHQAGSGAFWWDSEGSDIYKWLWNLLYTRMTAYHRLDNLIWVWSGCDEEYMPYSGYFDIISADIYPQEGGSAGSGYEEYYSLRNMAYGKPAAISECGGLPDIDAAFRDGSVWSYFALWYDPYLTDEDNEYVDSETLIKVYNSEGVITKEDYIAYCKENSADTDSEYTEEDETAE